MAIIDMSNWNGNDDTNWVNSPTGIINVVHGKKLFGQDEVPGPWDHVGHYRSFSIPFAPGLTFQQTMEVTKDTDTDVIFGLRTDASYFYQGCAGVYFAAYQTGELQAFLWDVNTNNTSPIRIPIVKNKDYAVRIVTQGNGTIEAFLGHTSLGVSVNWGSAPTPNLYGMLAFSQCGNGTGMAVIDNYRVSS